MRAGTWVNFRWNFKNANHEYFLFSFNMEIYNIYKMLLYIIYKQWLAGNN